MDQSSTSIENTYHPESSHGYENGSTMEDVSVETPQELADRYRLIRELGHGAQGTVYLAERLNGEGLVAIKRLEIDSVQTWKEYELFHREASVLQTLNIKGVAKFIEAPDYLQGDAPCAYIVQEYIDGLSLETMMHNGYRLTLHKIFRLALNLIDILEQLHSHVPPIIHRDIKPANILMKPLENGDFQPYLIDFGAVSNPQIQSGGSTVAGTYGYMPPEQLMGRPVPASDYYSLAAMIVYLLSGVEPGEMQVTDFHLVIHPYLENVPRSVVSVLHQMLHPKVDQRLADYHVLRERFLLFMQDQFELSDDSGCISDDHLTLRDVKSLGQRGNMDLWISLPDSTPRNIPEIYRTLRQGQGMELESVYPKLIRYNRKSKRYMFGFFCLPVIFFIAGLLILIVCLKSATSWSNLDGELLFGGSLFFFAGIVFGIVMVYSYYYHPYLKYIKNQKHKTEQEKYNIHFNDSDKQMFETLFAFGTKSIATVVSYEYIPSSLAGAEVYYLTKMGPDLQTTINGQHPLIPVDDKVTAYYHLRPSFKLIYKFNPPDDDNPEDLYHTVILHTDFSETLKVGDALPILYYINPKDNMDVMSMPFPYPVHDFFSYQDMIHHK